MPTCPEESGGLVCASQRFCIYCFSVGTRHGAYVFVLVSIIVTKIPPVSYHMMYRRFLRFFSINLRSEPCLIQIKLAVKYFGIYGRSTDNSVFFISIGQRSKYSPCQPGGIKRGLVFNNSLCQEQNIRRIFFSPRTKACPCAGGERIIEDPEESGTSAGLAMTSSVT